jgi:hypothetical protein
MKLNTALVERTLNQFDAQAILENHPVVQQLNSLFGDHTFCLDASGLNIVEPTGQTVSGSQTGKSSSSPAGAMTIAPAWRRTSQS